MVAWDNSSSRVCNAHFSLAFAHSDPATYTYSAVSLRVQTTEENKTEFKAVSPERAFADYIFGSIILHFFVVNFIN